MNEEIENIKYAGSPAGVNSDISGKIAECFNRLDKLAYHYHQLTRRQVELDIRLKQMEGRLISVKDKLEKK